MAKPAAGGRRPRRRERKNVTYGVAHIKSSFNNTIVTITDQEGNAAERFRSGGVPLERVRLRRLRRSWNPIHHVLLLFGLPGDVKRLRDVIRRLDIDVVLLTGLANPHGAIAADREGRAVLWQIVDTVVPTAGRRVLMPFVARLADTVMFWGEAVERLHTDGRTLGMPTLLGNSPVDLTRFVPSHDRAARTRAELGIPATADVVGTVANLNPQKGLEYFIRAAARIAAGGSDVWFVVVGGRYETHRAYARKLEAEVRSSNMSERFRFVGAVANVEDYYAAMDVKLITSIPGSEGIPTTALEAMACGVPVVTTDVGSAREAVLDGVTGYVVPPLDEDAMAAATVRLLSDPTLRATLGDRGRRRAEEHYGIEPCVEAHLRALAAAIEHRRNRGRIVRSDGV